MPARTSGDKGIRAVLGCDSLGPLTRNDHACRLREIAGRVIARCEASVPPRRTITPGYRQSIARAKKIPRRKIRLEATSTAGYGSGDAPATVIRAIRPRR